MTLESINTAFSVHSNARDCHVKIVGIRGSAPINSLGVYDDLICRVIGTTVDVFQASVDPGWHFIQNPVNPKGCAQLKAGLWWFKFGLHHGHPALVQSEDFDVWRLDKTGKRVSSERGQFGINIHSGGCNPKDVGHWSAGCQVIESDPPWGEDWLRYYNGIKYACDTVGQLRVPYLLVESLPAMPV